MRCTRVDAHPHGQRKGPEGRAPQALQAFFQKKNIWNNLLPIKLKIRKNGQIHRKICF